MSKLTANQAADSLQIFDEVRVLRPDWQNPADPNGTGLELSTSATLEELLLRHRTALMALTYAAQFLVVYTTKAPLPAVGQGHDDEPISLNHTRHETDMIWHTDEVHRRHGSVNIIAGESDTPSGLAAKHRIATLITEMRRHTQRIWPMLDLRLHRLQTGHASMLYTDVASDLLAELWASLEYNQQSEPDSALLKAEFWDYLAHINTDPSLVWVGRTPPEKASKDQAIFTAITGYHCKRYTPDHATHVDRSKVRLELRPTLAQRRMLDGYFAHLNTTQKAAPILDAAILQSPQRN